MTAAEIVKALGGKNGTARCPAHKDRTPSLSVSERDGKLLVHCHAGCSQADVWAALKDRGLVFNGETPRKLKGVSKSHDGILISDRRAEALTVWGASVPAIGTPAQAYLQARGIVVQPPPAIRYHEGINALVALVQAKDGTFSGCQRVYLKNRLGNYSHRGKYSLGPIKGGAVRLTPAAESLQLAESVDDGLALLQMTGKPTWAVPGAGFIPTFEPPPEVREVILAPDHDAAGLEAIEKTILSDAHVTLKFRRLLPPPGLDWCDVLPDYDERMAVQEEPEPPRSWVEEFVDG